MDTKTEVDNKQDTKEYTNSDKIKYMKKIISLVFKKFPYIYLIGSGSDSFKQVGDKYVFTGINVNNLNFIIEPKLPIQTKISQLLQFQNYFEDRRVSWSEEGSNFSNNLCILKGTFLKLPLYFEIDIIFSMKKYEYDYMWDIYVHNFGINKFGIKHIWSSNVDKKVIDEYKDMVEKKKTKLNKIINYLIFQKNIKKDWTLFIDDKSLIYFGKNNEEKCNCGKISNIYIYNTENEEKEFSCFKRDCVTFNCNKLKVTILFDQKNMIINSSYLPALEKEDDIYVSDISSSEEETGDDFSDLGDLKECKSIEFDENGNIIDKNYIDKNNNQDTNDFSDFDKEDFNSLKESIILDG